MPTSVDERTGTIYPGITRFREHVQHSAPLLLPALQSQSTLFGSTWENEFDELIRRFVGPDDAALKQAVEGYVGFILDGMRLQKVFEKTRKYAAKTYADASSEVYLNREYMLTRYLPGLMLSHYLWPHHYRQHLFFARTFIPRFRKSVARQFVDVGIGTGFYSRLLLTACPHAEGQAYDISTSAIEYAHQHLASYGVANRWVSEVRDVIADAPRQTWPFLMNVEVLEHLEDPLLFLRSLRGMLEPGGLAFIAAAANAAERDHIYLYESADQVQDHLEAAGFSVLDRQEDKAYRPDGDQPVPSNAAFLVTTA